MSQFTSGVISFPLVTPHFLKAAYISTWAYHFTTTVIHAMDRSALLYFCPDMTDQLWFGAVVCKWKNIIRKWLGEGLRQNLAFWTRAEPRRVSNSLLYRKLPGSISLKGCCIMVFYWLLAWMKDEVQQSFFRHKQEQTVVIKRCHIRAEFCCMSGWE